ncbi:MAG: c-type cytochrome [Acidobacteriota bacterium]|nr:c-type cytochrome [Acidobacteriota bacterium]
MGCHRPFGAREIPNPGSRWGTVPRFASGNAMMYAKDRGQIEELVRFGAPVAWLEDPRASERLAGQRVRMPAYGEALSEREIADLTAFACAVEGVEPAGGEAAAAGRELARRQGCHSCHGPEGSGGMPNPGSLGGFVPGFLGGNFSDLVRDEAEFREWVLDGTSRRLAANPLVRTFWRRQLLSMPAYRGELTGEELTQLWAWVEATRASSPE